MRAYFIKRLLLIIPTLLGITIACFFIMQMVPGGPVEQAIQRMKQAAHSGQAAGLNIGNSNSNMTQDEIENIKKYYGFDKPVLVRYFNWLGKLVRLDFGTSYAYEEPVLHVIVSRFPVSLTFGLVGMFFTYLICIPLGIKKALQHDQPFDHWSSVLIFLGYSIPSFVLAVVLIVLFGGGSFWNLFPISGIVSDNFEDLSFFAKIFDYIHHMFLPILCYTVGGFATLTLLMKNSLMEQLNQDYIRTALAKGLTYKQAVFRHGLRNALIPIATNIGMIIGVILSGSMLIETIFTIDGMGLLGYESIVNRDYPVALGLIVISSLLVLLGRIISDFCLIMVDPRIKFQ
ncbi:MAG TPA: peptide ABC transporter permease [Firmicutes bacterium]|jgi:microcin C transport system permease protein|nr:peptide ABC transporter permease [Bacillota bacterium]